MRDVGDYRSSDSPRQDVGASGISSQQRVARLVRAVDGLEVILFQLEQRHSVSLRENRYPNQPLDISTDIR